MALKLPLQPFSRPVPEVHLADAPVARVLVQLRFPASTGLITDNTALTRIAAALANQYPTYQEGVEASFQFAGMGQAPATSSHKTVTVKSSSGKTAVTVSPTSITYQSSEYESRVALLRELEAVLAVAMPVVRPSSFDRIGVRYSNLFPRDERLALNVKSAIFEAEQIAQEGVTLQQSISETVYKIDATTALLVRSALLPAGAVIDPGLVAPAGSSGTFLLDLDGFTPGSTADTEPHEVLAKIENLAEVASGYFLWSLTEEGAKAFGADSR